MIHGLHHLKVFMAAIGLLQIGARCSAAEDVQVILGLIDDAPEHATITVPPGEYHGTLTIDKSVILEGNGQVIIDGDGEGDVVRINAPETTLRGFTIRNSGSTVDREPAGIRALSGPVVLEDNVLVDVLFGIDLREAPDSIVRQNTIHGKDFELGRRGDGIRLWWSHGCTVENNTVIALRDMVFWYSENLTIAENEVSDSRYGLHFMYSHHTLLRDNFLHENSVGIYLMYSNNIRLVGNNMTNNRGVSGYGIGLKDCDNITVERNALLANRVGMYVDNSPSSVDSVGLIDHNMFAFNEIGLLATPITHDNVITGNAFVENEEQAAAHGGGKLALNTFMKDGVGNFWSDYAGYDRDGDGVGDFPYEHKSLFYNLLAREPNLRLFVHSPAQQAIEFTARTFPEVQPEPVVVDDAPLTRPPQLRLLTSEKPVDRVPMVLVAAALLGTGFFGGVFLLRRPNLAGRSFADYTHGAYEP